jgi:type IV pilus assembly protein PilN
MLVDINLLPKRDEKNIAFYVITIIVVLLLTAASIFFVISLNGKKDELQYLDKQISLNQTILDNLYAKLSQYETSSSIEELENAIKWVNEQPYNLVYILQQLTKSLPQRGFIIDYEMNEEHVITQRVQFDTKSEAAYYLTSILKYSWVEEAIISEAKTTEVLKDNSEQISYVYAILNEANILPRYYAEYQIRLDIQKVKELSEKQNSTNDEEGGAAP